MQNDVVVSRDLEPTAFQEVEIRGAMVYVGTWTCDPKVRNRLCWATGDPVIAREVHFEYGKIAWRAGQGWPEYHEPCPLDYKKDGDYWPSYEHHCLMWEFGGGVWHTCDTSGGFRGWKATEIYCAVNDDNYGDNTGTWVVQIVRYSGD